MEPYLDLFINLMHSRLNIGVAVDFIAVLLLGNLFYFIFY